MSVEGPLQVVWVLTIVTENELFKEKPKIEVFVYRNKQVCLDILKGRVVLACLNALDTLVDKNRKDDDVPELLKEWFEYDHEAGKWCMRSTRVGIDYHENFPYKELHELVHNMDYSWWYSIQSKDLY